MWSLKVAPNAEFSRSASVRRDRETRVTVVGVDIKPRKKKKERAGRGPPLRKPARSKSGKSLLLRGFRFDAVVGQRETRLVAVGGVRGAQTAHHRPDAGAVGAVDLGALKGLRRPLQNRLLLLLNFGSLSLGHLSLLLRIAQTSNVKRGSRLCQTSSKVGSESV